jgi:hypothetical protein
MKASPANNQANGNQNGNSRLQNSPLITEHTGNLWLLGIV